MSEKIQKVLARLGYGSRRVLEGLIEEGKIKVNGDKAQLGDRVSPGDTLEFQGKKIPYQGPEDILCRVLLYNKPEGQVCTRTDPEGRPTVFDVLPKVKDMRWVNVGRLDLNSQGLLLFTTDGDFANKLMHPSSEVERTYAVRVFGEVTEEHIAQLKQGVMLEDGMAKFDDILPQGGEGMNSWFHVCISEGKKREVRRMWEAVGCQVSRLIRVKFGTLNLPKDLKPGRYVELDKEDIESLSECIKASSYRSGLYGRARAQKKNKSAKSNQTKNTRNNNRSNDDQSGNMYGDNWGNKKHSGHNKPNKPKKGQAKGNGNYRQQRNKQDDQGAGFLRRKKN